MSTREYAALVALLDEVYEATTTVVAGLDEESFDERTRTELWSVKDLLFHQMCDAQRALVVFTTEPDQPADTTAVSYWSAWQPGQPGNFAAADVVRKLEVPTQLDRSQGDVHAAGNPHIQTDPRNIAQVATALGTRLQQVDPAHAADYAQRQAVFSQRWQQAMARWNAQAAPRKGAPVVSQHKAFVYLYDWLGLKEVAVLEPKPGVEPTASHLQEVLTALKSAPPRMVLYASYQDGRPSEWLSKNAGIPAVKLPATVGGTDGAKDLFGYFDDTLTRLLAAGGKP